MECPFPRSKARHLSRSQNRAKAVETSGSFCNAFSESPQVTLIKADFGGRRGVLPHASAHLKQQTNQLRLRNDPPNQARPATSTPQNNRQPKIGRAHV